MLQLFYLFRLNPYEGGNIVPFGMLVFFVFIAIVSYIIIVKSDPVKFTNEDEKKKRLIIRKTIEHYILISSSFLTFLIFALLFSDKTIIVDLLFMYIVAALCAPALYIFKTYAHKKRKYLNEYPKDKSSNLIIIAQSALVWFCASFALLTILILLVGFENPPPLKYMLFKAIWIAGIMSIVVNGYKLFRLSLYR